MFYNLEFKIHEESKLQEKSQLDLNTKELIEQMNVNITSTLSRITQSQEAVVPLLKKIFSRKAGGCGEKPQ